MKLKAFVWIVGVVYTFQLVICAVQAQAPRPLGTILPAGVVVTAVRELPSQALIPVVGFVSLAFPEGYLVNFRKGKECAQLQVDLMSDIRLDRLTAEDDPTTGTCIVFDTEADHLVVVTLRRSGGE